MRTAAAISKQDAKRKPTCDISPSLKAIDQ